MSRMRTGSWCLTVAALVPIVLFSSLPASADLVGSDRAPASNGGRPGSDPGRTLPGCSADELADRMGRLSPDERAYFQDRPQCVQVVGGITIPEFIGGLILLSAIAIVAIARVNSR